MEKQKVPWSLFTRMVGGLGLIVVFVPSVVVLLAHRFIPGLPAHVDFLTRMLISSFGLLVCLIGLVPTLVRMNRE